MPRNQMSWKLDISSRNYETLCCVELYIKNITRTFYKFTQQQLGHFSRAAYSLMDLLRTDKRIHHVKNQIFGDSTGLHLGSAKSCVFEHST
ncbi:conserved hypothetical protein [Vibrio crassostreae]|nr:conserved hypothetical protein [Vibrio crassostreae]